MLARTTAHPPPPLSSRKELFAHHVARGASLAQAARLAGYSPQGARQRGSVLMAESDVRLRVEVLRHAWMDERKGRVEQAIKRLDKIIDMALELQRPTAALKAMEFQLKLSGVIRDTRAGLYADSPDDDLSKAFFDPREDEDPDFDPAPQSGPAEAEAFLPTPKEPEDDAEEDAEATEAPDHDKPVHSLSFQAFFQPPASPRPVQPQLKPQLSPGAVRQWASQSASRRGF
jgi:phage terminase small subunit